MSDEITLICILAGESTAFPVDINPQKTIGHLKDAIKEEKSRLGDIAANQLNLYHERSKEPEELDDLTSEISEGFGTAPPKKTIHAIIQRPSAAKIRIDSVSVQHQVTHPIFRHEFYNRKELTEELIDAAATCNYRSRGVISQANHTMVLIPGVGIGKSCAGWESRRLLHPGLFEGSMNLNLDKLTVEGFNIDIDRVIKILELHSLEHGHALKAIIIHMDEYQLYIDCLQQYNHWSWSMARNELKQMLKQIGNVMRKVQSDHQLLIPPICTGTSAQDMHFLATEYGKVMIPLEPLDLTTAKSMFCDKFQYNCDKVMMTERNSRTVESLEKLNPGIPYATFSSDVVLQHSKGLCDYVWNQPHFKISLADTGYIPGFIDFLLSVDYLLTIYDWEKAVEREFKLSRGRTIGDGERDGITHLRQDTRDENLNCVTVPFIYLQVLNRLLSPSILPADALSPPTADRKNHWQEYESLHGYYQMALDTVGNARPLNISPQNWQYLSDVFRGAKGDKSLQRKIQLRKLDVFVEKNKSLELSTSVAEFETSVVYQDHISRELYD
ncbi:hypothetical protein BX616_011132, partial [Lobosporangium transversale]